MAMMAGAAFAIMELIVRSTTVARVCMRLNRVANFSISCQVLSLKVEVLWIESDQHWSDGPDSSHIIVLGKLLVQVQRSNGISRRAGHPHRDTLGIGRGERPGETGRLRRECEQGGL